MGGGMAVEPGRLEGGLSACHDRARKLCGRLLQKVHGSCKKVQTHLGTGTHTHTHTRTQTPHSHVLALQLPRVSPPPICDGYSATPPRTVFALARYLHTPATRPRRAPRCPPPPCEQAPRRTFSSAMLLAATRVSCSVNHATYYLYKPPSLSHATPLRPAAPP